MNHTLHTYRKTLLESTAATNCTPVRPPSDGTEASLWVRPEVGEWMIRLGHVSDEVSYYLYNLAGQQVQHATFQNIDLIHLSTKGLASGVYILRFEYDGGTNQWQVAIF